MSPIREATRNEISSKRTIEGNIFRQIDTKKSKQAFRLSSTFLHKVTTIYIYHLKIYMYVGGDSPPMREASVQSPPSRLPIDCLPSATYPLFHSPFYTYILYACNAAESYVGLWNGRLLKPHTYICTHDIQWCQWHIQSFKWFNKISTNSRKLNSKCVFVLAMAVVMGTLHTHTHQRAYTLPYTYMCICNQSWHSLKEWVENEINPA